MTLISPTKVIVFHISAVRIRCENGIIWSCLWIQVFFVNHSLKMAQLKMPSFLIFLKSEPKGERISGTMSKLEKRLRFQREAEISEIIPCMLLPHFTPNEVGYMWNKTKMLSQLYCWKLSFLLREDLHICSGLWILWYNLLLYVPFLFSK